jgi:hypothetical protein
MILGAVALALAIFQPGQQAPARPPMPASAVMAESRRAIMLRDAGAVAGLGIPRAIAVAPEKGVALPRRLYMPYLRDFYLRLRIPPR